MSQGGRRVKGVGESRGWVIWGGGQVKGMGRSRGCHVEGVPHCRGRQVEGASRGGESSGWAS